VGAEREQESPLRVLHTGTPANRGGEGVGFSNKRVLEVS
jgi:hypothetical protein